VLCLLYLSPQKFCKLLNSLKKLLYNTKGGNLNKETPAHQLKSPNHIPTFAFDLKMEHQRRAVNTFGGILDTN